MVGAAHDARHERPHDVPDLHLAPVVLAIDARIDELASLTTAELRTRVAVESDYALDTPVDRAEALLRVIRYLIDLHGWEISWDPRGLRLGHERRGLVLGVPDSFQESVDQAD